MLGHELAHVYNRDILITSVAAGLASVIMYLATSRVAASAAASDEDGPGPLGALAGADPRARSRPALIQMAISRSREFQADASGAQVTGDPLALASALRKLEPAPGRFRCPRAEPADDERDDDRQPVPSRGHVELFSTHPPMAERIARLEQMAGYQR